MADAHEFKPENDVFSFNSLEQSLGLKHPEWTQEERHWEALSIFNTRMFPKQVSSYLAEKRGQHEMPIDAEYSVIDGKLVNPYYSFENMITNASTPEERKSLELYQETMVKVARGTYAIMPDLHSSQEGTHAVRYADISYKDYDGKIHLTKRVNIAQNNKDLSLEGSWIHLYTLARVGQGRQLIVDGIPKVGIVVVPPTEQTSPERLIQEFDHNVKENRQERQFLQNDRSGQTLAESMLGDVVVIHRQVSTNIKETFIQVKAFIEAKMKKRTIERQHAIIVPIEGVAKKTEGKESLPVFLKRGEKGTLNAQREAKKQLILQQRVFFGERNPVIVKKTMEKHVATEQTPRPGKVRKKERKRQHREQRMHKRITEMRTMHIVRQEYIKQPTKEKQFLRVRKSKEKHSLKKNEMRNRPEQRSIKREKKLLRIFRRFEKKLLQSPVQEKHTILENEKRASFQQHIEHYTQSEKRIINRFTRTWILWFLMCLPHHEMKTNDGIWKNKDQIKEKLVQQEPSPWILLSIIWHLAAIREHGFQKPAKKKRQKIKRTVQIPLLLPQQGIIFAFSS